jgi:hypothetical protein
MISERQRHPEAANLSLREKLVEKSSSADKRGLVTLNKVSDVHRGQPQAYFVKLNELLKPEKDFSTLQCGDRALLHAAKEPVARLQEHE